MNIKKIKRIKFWLSINSCCPFILLFLLKFQSDNIQKLIPEFKFWKFTIPSPYASYFAYIIIIITMMLILSVITKLLLHEIKKHFDQDKLKVVFKTDNSEEPISDLAPASDSFIITYLGLFFVALSIPDSNLILAIFLFIILLIIFSKTQSYFYNPIFLILGFNFYFINNSSNRKLLIITKDKTIEQIAEKNFTNLRRINDLTYIDMGDA